MTGYGLLAAHLRLAYTQDVFLIAMIHLDLPSIKAGLNQQLDGSPEISCQKESRLAIVRARVLGQLVRHRRDHDQPQSHEPRSPLPQNVFHFFVSQHTPLAPEVNPRAVPGAILLRAHSVGSEELLCIFAATSFWGPKAQPRVLAAASQQIGAIQLGLEHRLVGEATIADHQEPAASSASRVPSFSIWYRQWRQAPHVWGSAPSTHRLPGRTIAPASSGNARTSCNRRSSPGRIGPEHPASERWCGGQTRTAKRWHVGWRAS